MRKLMLGAALLLASGASLFSAVAASEPAAKPVLTAAMTVPELRSEPYTRVDAEAFARRVVLNGGTFLRYDYAGNNLWIVVYLP